MIFVFVLFLLTLSSQMNGSEADFYSALKCASPRRRDLVNRSVPVFVYKPNLGMAKLTQSSSSSSGTLEWTKRRLLGRPSVHHVTCDSRARCIVYVKNEILTAKGYRSISEHDFKLFAGEGRRFSYVRNWNRHSNSIRFFNKNQLLVFFDSRTGRFVNYVHLALLSKIKRC